MSMSHELGKFSRRQFLSLGGVMAAATLTPSSIMTGVSAMTTGGTPVALLLPDFALAPGASQAFLTGLSNPLESRFGLHTISSGRGLTTSVMAAARTALEGGAQIVAAYINEHDADDLLALTEAAGAGLMIINHGENIPRTDFTSPRFARASLNKWVMEYENGRYVGEGYRRPVMITSFYESGFDAHYAFRVGFESMGRGAVELPHFVFRNQAELGAILERIAAIEPDIVYAGFDGADFALYERLWALATPTITAGMRDAAQEFSRLGEVVAATLSRWDGAKFLPDFAALPVDAMRALTPYTQTVKTGWLHPYMAL